MEQQSEQNRSEQPTPYKLQRARRKGVVARGVDLGFMTSLAALLAWLSFSGPPFEARLAETSRRAIITANEAPVGSQAILEVTGQFLSVVARPLGFMLAVIFLAVLVFEFVQTGTVFSTEPLRPDFSRLDPGKGLKKIFSARLLLEFCKTLLKFVVYSAVAYGVISYAIHTRAPAVVDAKTLRDGMAQMGFRLLASFAVGAVLFAALDQALVRQDFLKRMRMSRREVRRESRDREGDPRMKQRRKRIHAEFVKQSKSLRNIRGADVLITNPTHYAVALRYDVGVMTAPAVVAQGADGFARRLKRVAFLYGVVIVENPPLARALYQAGRLEQQIPEALFPSVARIYMSNRDLLRRKKLGAAHD